MAFETTDVAAHVGQNIPNPLETLSGLANLQNSLNQNKMFQAKALAGEYLAHSVGPDGQPDMGKFSAGIQADPRTAPYAPEILQDAATLRGTGLTNTGLGISNQQSQTNLAASRVGNLQGFLGSIPVSTNPDPDAAKVENARNLTTGLAQATDAGLIDKGTATSLFGGNPGPDGATLADHLQMFARQGAISGKAGASGMEAQGYGTPTAVSTGAGTEIVAPNAVTGQAPQIGSTIANQLGPHDLASPIETLDSDGTKHAGVIGDYLNPNGTWKSDVPHPVTALGPLSANANAALGNAYGAQISSFEQSAAAAPQQRQLIENMRQEAAQFDSGPQSDAWQKLGEFAKEYNVSIPQFAGTGQTAAREAFRKTMTMVMGAQQQALHMDQTDVSRQTAQAAVPSSVTTPEGRQQVLGIIEGNADMIAAAGKAWQAQKAKGGPASWGQFQMEFPQYVPPSIFQAQYMTAEQKADMMKGWSAAKKTDWQKRYDKAAQLGWLPNVQ